MNLKTPFFRHIQHIVSMVFFKIIIIPFLICCIFLYVLYGPAGIFKTIHFNEGKYVVIPKSSNLSKIAEILEKEDIVPTHTTFIASVLLSGNKGKLKSGEYAIPLSSTPWEIANLLASGKTVIRKLTVVEGSSVNQVVKAINEIPVLIGEITKIPEEGFLMPDTYLYSYGDDRQKILDQMEKSMSDYLATFDQHLQNNTLLKNKNGLITLASLVEKETALGAERPVVAAVYLNRLKINMPLQCDPTVIYSLAKGERLERPLTKTDLNTDSPYNTYKVKGLPKGAIGCPGKASILAVLNPVETKALYFVSNGKGGHEFAENLTDHNCNVKQWRIFQKSQREGSKPIETPSITEDEITPLTKKSSDIKKQGTFLKQIYRKQALERKIKPKKIAAYKTKKKKR